MLNQACMRRANRIDQLGCEELPKKAKSSLFNEKTFYSAFVSDMLKAKSEVIICSPFMTKFRSQFFRATMEKLKNRNVSVFIFTRPLEEQDYLMRAEIACAIDDYEEAGANFIFIPGKIHEKIAIIDREILWEGSLNILSQRTSRELMRRIPDEDSALEIIQCLGLNKKLIESYKIKYEKLCQSLKVDSNRDLKLKVSIFILGLLIVAIAIRLFILFESVISLSHGIMSIIKH